MWGTDVEHDRPVSKQSKRARVDAAQGQPQALRRHGKTHSSRQKQKSDIFC
jgi:hypothetical protein